MMNLVKCGLQAKAICAVVKLGGCGKRTAALTESELVAMMKVCDCDSQR